jgi:hypothetical protein
MTHTSNRTPLTKSLLIAITTGALVLSLGACQAAEPEESADAKTTAETPTTPNTTAQDSLPNDFQEGTDEWVAWEALMGPDGEYAAAASYQAVLDAYGQVEPYATILQAELRHISALQRQLERMGVVVPENPYSGQIQAPADLQTAAEAWAEGEILNVEMYDELIQQTDDEGLLRVLNNLRRSSLESHLPAFELAAKNGGVSP